MSGRTFDAGCAEALTLAGVAVSPPLHLLALGAALCRGRAYDGRGACPGRAGRLRLRLPQWLGRQRRLQV
eukprot:scaffold6789_cov115-Isochrysis_galbana.AAC.4